MIPQQWASPCENQCTSKYAMLMQIPWRVFCKKGCDADGETWEECLEQCNEICYKDPVLKDRQWSAYIDRSPGASSYSEKAGDCDFFEWADKEMSAYEKRLVQHLKEMEERRQADNDKVEELIEKKCKEQLAQHLKEMEEKIEELIEKKCKEQLAQHNEKMFRC